MVNTTLVTSQAAAITWHFWHLEMHPDEQKHCTS